jgi:hypothetical protein
VSTIETIAPRVEPDRRCHPVAVASQTADAEHRRQVLDAYRYAWNQREEPEARSWLERCWTTTSVYCNPFIDAVRGQDAMARLIVDYPLIFPDAAFEQVGAVAVHHEHACYRWRLTSSAEIRIKGTNFGRQLVGHDVVDFIADRIHRVVSFFDAPAAPSAPVRSVWASPSLR